MTTTTKRDLMRERIERHGRQLLAIFPQSLDQDPVSLCKKLRRLESLAASIGLQLCNGPEMSQEAAQRRVNEALTKTSTLLGIDNTKPGAVPIFCNLDPRGYALKIEDAWMRANRERVTLYQDWGGYGILAPDLREG